MSVLYADAMESINCSVKCDLEAKPIFGSTDQGE
jgi:hypothetical protein